MRLNQQLPDRWVGNYNIIQKSAYDKSVLFYVLWVTVHCISSIEYISAATKVLLGVHFCITWHRGLGLVVENVISSFVIPWQTYPMPAMSANLNQVWSENRYGTKCSDCQSYSTSPEMCTGFTFLMLFLTHCDRVTHICVGTNTNIGSDNGLSPGRRQAIIWTNAGILFIEPLGTNFSGITSEIHTFSFKKMHF